MNPKTQNPHPDITELLPWYVNGTLAQEERARLAAHLSACESCRAALHFEELLYARVSEQSTLEYMPAASLKKLQTRLDGVTHLASEPAVTASAPRRTRARPALLAASLAAVAIAAALWTADRFAHRPSAAGGYYTVTSAAERPPEEVIRAVFTADLTLEQLQTVLDQARLRIVSGPTEAGVYSLASTSTQPVATSLSTLRHNAAVRFAETTRVVTENGRTP